VKTTLARTALGGIVAPSTLGVLGGGQLGRMFVHAAQRMGYGTVVLDPDPTSPAAAVAHQHVQGSTEDLDALAQMMQRCAAVTTEFENVSAPAMAVLASRCVLAPAAASVAIAQNRIAEKTMLAQVAAVSGDAQAGPVAFAAIEKDADIAAAPDECFPGVLKTATLGYDGKGQVWVSTRAQAQQAFAALGGGACVLEQLAPLAAECSVVLARGADGQMVSLPVARNVHVNGILASSEVFEGNLPFAVAEAAQAAAKRIAEHLNYVGVLCVEFFVLKDAQGAVSQASALRVNEIAPRPHNSGHWSLEGASVNQFELQVRTLCGLPLAQPQRLASCVMLNLLGDVWLEAQAQQRTPDWAAVLALPGVALHLYGKADARRNRKMGHVTITGSSPEQACRVAVQVAGLLGLAYAPCVPLAG
jgi:5-(carboxyamino)imidazole ribonucleotide synthase